MDEIDDVIDKLHAQGATDDEITQIISEKFGKQDEPGFVARAANAIGPAIRGIGDLGVPFTNIDINHGLEASGLVEHGRLTGPESNEREAATRTLSNAAGGTVIAGKLISGATAMRNAHLAEQAANAAKASRAARTAKFMETGLIDASPEVIPEQAPGIIRGTVNFAKTQAQKHPYVTGMLLDRLGLRALRGLIP